MAFRLVAIDLDGTLLTSAGQVSESTAQVLADARRSAGAHVVIASARPPRSVQPFYDQLHLDSPTINYNGALVYHPPSRRVLMHRPIAAKVARLAVRVAREVFPKVLVSAEILDKWYTDRLDETYATETAKTWRPDVVAPLGQWLNQAVTKLLFLGPAEPLAEVGAAMRGALSAELIVVQTDRHLLQVSHRLVSKAQALRTVAFELGVPQQEVMAVGDHLNDVAMVRWAGLGVAVGNAHAETLAAADYVTGHNDAEGVADAVRRFVLDGTQPE